MNYQRESVKIMLFWENYPLKVFSFRILFVSLVRVSFRWANGSFRWFPITLWVNKSIRYYSRSAKSVGNFHGYNVTRIICDRVSVDIWMPQITLLAMQSRNRRGAFLWVVWGFLSYATSKLNAIRCIALLLCLGVIDSWVPNDYHFLWQTKIWMK